MTFLALVPSIYTNVLQYGAVGDGSTDDTAAINSALAAIPTGTGGVLYFPPNKTYITSGIDISAYSGNLVIAGGGWSSVLKLKNGTNGYIIKNTSGAQQGTRITNLKLDCNGANQTAASGGIYGYKWRRCLIDFCYITNPWQAGIWLDAVSGDFGYQNRIANNFIFGGSSTPGGTNSWGNGLRLTWTDENHIYANHFEQNGNFADSTYGFHIYDQNGLADYIGNSFVNGYGVMKFDGLQNRVIGNAFDGNGSNCIQMNGSASQTIVKANTFLNVGYRASGGSANSVNGIYLNATQCIIEGNYFQAAGGSTPYTNSFVRVDTGATYCSIIHNEFNVQATSGTLSGPVIFVSGQPAGCRVRFNNGYDNVNSRAAFLTENHGTATITAGTTSVVVTHGLAITPLLEQIMITPQASSGTDRGYWVSNATSTQFTVNLNSSIGADFPFGWVANVGY